MTRWSSVSSDSFGALVDDVLIRITYTADFLFLTGATGFIHVANDMTGSRDPAVAIPRAVHGALNALKASAREPGMRRFVYTSSTTAATMPKPGVKFTIHADTYNDEAAEEAWKPNADRHVVYAASKTAAERAVFEWVEENKPPFVVNAGNGYRTELGVLLSPANDFAVLPNCNIGPLISAANQGYPTTARFVKGLWDGDYEALRGNPPEHFVNVQDVGRLHVVGLASPDVKGERILAATAPFNFNGIIEVLRKICPERKWEDYP
ncbi:NAD-dependent epimerase/dehydratase family protein, partial [Candidatus Bathyarchaeota archaeon]|nr:NAD-dependent epimerase/dehydratase family protein [Candidatus Bathyarchaeota archaeon]